MRGETANAETLNDWRQALKKRPLGGMTILVVEDSRLASEAVRLLCLRSGARIRRADTLRAALRHLQSYRPDVVLVDMGLPDGNGAELIQVMNLAVPRIPVILGLSGDPDNQSIALTAGADGFLPKPIESLALFQNAILSALPPDQRPKGLRLLDHDDLIRPDPAALHDDLLHASVLLSAQRPDELAYIVQFLAGVARTAHDKPLEEAAASLARAQQSGQAQALEVARLSGLVDARLSCPTLM